MQAWIYSDVTEIHALAQGWGCLSSSDFVVLVAGDFNGLPPASVSADHHIKAHAVAQRAQSLWAVCGFRSFSFCHGKDKQCLNQIQERKTKTNKKEKNRIHFLTTVAVALAVNPDLTAEQELPGEQLEGVFSLP